MTINIIFLGPPGCGKGTQSATVSEKMELTTISTGEILRREVLNKTESGRIVSSYIESGSLVPDGFVIKIIKNFLESLNNDKGLIFDGFPRNKSQAVILDEMLSEIGQKIDAVFYFSVEDDVIVRRILGRFACKTCGSVYNKFFKKLRVENVCDKCFGSDFESRSDDTEATIKNRLKTYRDITYPLIDYYKNNNLLFEIDGLKDPALVSEDLLKIIHNFSKKY